MSESTRVRYRRGTASQHESFTGASSELTVNTTNKSLHVHDGVTTGGVELARSDLANINVGVLTNVQGANFSGVVTAASFVGQVIGVAASTAQLETPRIISLFGDVVGQTLFDGTSDVSIAATIQPNSVALGTDTFGNYVATIVGSGLSDIVVSNSGTETANVVLGLSTTGVTTGSYGSASSIPTFTVDSRGRLTSAGSVNVATALTVIGDSGSEVINLLNESLTISGGTNLTSSSVSNTVTINLDPNISLSNVNASGFITTPSLDVGIAGTIITATSDGLVGVNTTDPRYGLEVGPVGAAGTQLWVNGDARVTGILSVGQGTITFDGVNNTITVGTSLTVTESVFQYSGIISATSITGNVVGAASSANILTTSRTINGIAFDGSSDIITNPSSGAYSNGYGTRTISNAVPSGGTSGDIHYRY